MGTCRFKSADLKRCIQHALAAPEHEMGYEDMTDEQYAALGMAPPQRTPRGPALLFVHDRGVYLMSNGIPRDSEGVSSGSHVAYAEGCSPNVDDFDDWYGTSRDLVGGDDFVEVIPINAEHLAACDEYAEFEVVLSESALEAGFVRPLKKAKNNEQETIKSTT
jgi:hypothetical protein